MELISDPQAWLSFLTLTMLEIVLGIDNIIFLLILVGRLPPAQRKSARLLGLGFAMLTRIGLLFSITWLASLRTPLFVAAGIANALSIQFLNNALFAGTLLSTMPIVSASPVFTMLLGLYVFKREVISWRTLATIALIVPGVILVALGG